MTSQLPFVSIIIPTYNRANLLPITLDSFLGQDYPADRYEIIIADNNSSDDTREIAARYTGSTAVPVSYLFEPRQGVHYARNRAALQARGSILYFTDDDMIADGALLTEIVKLFSLDPAIGSATGRIVGKFDEPPPAWVKKYLTNEKLSLTRESQREELIVSTEDLVYSCHQAVRREAFFGSGGFNPENTGGVWIGDGETGLGIKLKQNGFKFAYTARSVIYHMIPPSRTTLAYLIKRSSNQANCDGYSEYRRHRNREKILRGMLRRSTFELAVEIKRSLLNVLNGLESWRFLPALFAYYHQRNRYDLRLYRDAEFRKLVEIDDWLNEG